MPGAPRPNEEAKKIAYAILKTPKDKQQNKETDKPTKKMIREWYRDSSTAQ